MEKSYQEIMRLLELSRCLEYKERVYKGSRRYLPDETTPVISPAAEDLAARAMGYSSGAPLYVVAIGALTNVASAILLRPEIVDRIVIVWLGGNAFEWPDNREFNALQDVAAARVVFNSGAAVVQLPAWAWFPLSVPLAQSWSTICGGRTPCAITWFPLWSRQRPSLGRAYAGAARFGM